MSVRWAALHTPSHPALARRSEEVTALHDAYALLREIARRPADSEPRSEHEEAAEDDRSVDETAEGVAA